MANLLTAKDLAERLSVSQRKAYSLKNVIGYVQIEGNIRFETSAVEAYISSCQRPPLPEHNKTWQTRMGTATSSTSRKSATADDVRALLAQKKEKRESMHARTVRDD